MTKPKQPDWPRSEMRKELREFIQIYNTRPVGRVSGGMQLDHSFALWYILKRVAPKAVIENGVFQGHSTWLIRKALPSAKIFSFDPLTNVVWRDNSTLTTYYIGPGFRDFAHIRWGDIVNPNETLLFFDDHQAHVKRIFQALTFGFKHVIFEDNYKGGDFYSLKEMCDPQLKAPIIFREMWGGTHRVISSKEHALYVELMNATLLTYYEFPPIALKPGDSKHDPSDATDALYQSSDTEYRDLNAMVEGDKAITLFSYEWIVYVVLNV